MGSFFRLLKRESATAFMGDAKYGTFYAVIYATADFIAATRFAEAWEDQGFPQSWSGRYVAGAGAPKQKKGRLAPPVSTASAPNRDRDEQEAWEQAPAPQTPWPPQRTVKRLPLLGPATEEIHLREAAFSASRPCSSL
jgi:hypothetical protein